jgi:hypothetical protein
MLQDELLGLGPPWTIRGTHEALRKLERYEYVELQHGEDFGGCTVQITAAGRQALWVLDAGNEPVNPVRNRALRRIRMLAIAAMVNLVINVALLVKMHGSLAAGGDGGPGLPHEGVIVAMLFASCLALLLGLVESADEGTTLWDVVFARGRMTTAVASAGPDE